MTPTTTCTRPRTASAFIVYKQNDLFLFLLAADAGSSQLEFNQEEEELAISHLKGNRISTQKRKSPTRRWDSRTWRSRYVNKPLWMEQIGGTMAVPYGDTKDAHLQGTTISNSSGSSNPAIVVAAVWLRSFTPGSPFFFCSIEMYEKKSPQLLWYCMYSCVEAHFSCEDFLRRRLLCDTWILFK